MNEWISVKDRLPDNGKIVLTKIDDHNGVRNVQALKRIDGLWFLPNKPIYVYYMPTHWMLLKEGENEK